MRVPITPLRGLLLPPREGEATVVADDGLLAVAGSVVALGDYPVAVGRR